MHVGRGGAGSAAPFITLPTVENVNFLKRNREAIYFAMEKDII